MSVKENTVFLSTTNSRYLPITVNLVRTLNQFHPEVKLCLLIVNLTEDEKESLVNMHSNIELIEDNGEFDDFYHEKSHCAHNRTWHMPKLMEDYGYSIFWLDADVYLKDDINELFEILEKQDIDFMIRAKKLDPFTCNCGMVWAKSTKQNLEILKEWERRTDELRTRARPDLVDGAKSGVPMSEQRVSDSGLLYWFSDQEGLNATIQNNMQF